MTFSMPSPVLEIQLATQYQRNVGTESAAKRSRPPTGTAASSVAASSASLSLDMRWKARP